MKITFLSFYSGHIERGAENFVAEIASRLGRRQEVTIIQSGSATRGQGIYRTEIIPSNINWEIPDLRTSLKRKLFLDYWSRQVKAFSFKAIKKIGNADIIIPTDSGWESILTRFWAWRNNARVVIIGHSGKGWDDRINLLTRPDVFVTLSDFQAKWARKNAFGVRVTKIPNGIDLDRFNPGVKPISIDLPRPIVLCVGALEPNKRVDLTIRAVARMKKGSLLAIGDGQSREEIIQLGNRLLPGRFRQLRTSYADMPRYYTATDVFTLPTVWWEPFGLVYLEAMACGLPVVAPNDPIRREIVGNGGLFVDPINTDAYARALLRALSMDWGQSPLFQAQKFSWDRVASQYEDLFRSII